MGQLFFKLNNVPDDEAQAVRDLLTEAHIDWYETRAGFWGVGLAALWLHSDADLQRANQLLAHYQRQLGERMRDQPVESLAQRIARKPLAFVAVLLAVAMILYLSVIPLLGAWG